MNVHISYRREDSADVTGRINERLTQRYGHNVVFQDIDNIPLGVDFRQHLDRALSRCNVLLAVVGDRWIEGENGVGQRRIDDPRDHLRLELEAALRRDIPVIPVLVRRAAVPGFKFVPTPTLTATWTVSSKGFSLTWVASPKTAIVDACYHLDRQHA